MLSFEAILLLITVTFFSCSKKSSPPMPVANFTYSGAGLAPSKVTFVNTSSNAISYTWDFGDNETSTETSPSHTFKKGGVFTVKLTATGEGGSHSTTKTVNITAPTSVKILGIKLSGMSFTNPSGAGWDATTGPDIFCTVTDNSDVILLTGQTFNDVTGLPPSLSWGISPGYQITNFVANYKFKIWDYDTPDPNDFIGGYSFSFSSLAAAGYPTTPVLQKDGDPLKIELLLEWK